MDHSNIDLSHTRNIAIIAHIDHGKSTLADRLMEMSVKYNARLASDRQLDSLDLEKERGITIKAHPVTVFYKHPDTDEMFAINLIDTPGHVDFCYEVSRSLAACDGAILIIDATQGIQAQTLSTLFMAIDYGITIVPVLNKIDLPAADIENSAMQIEELLGISETSILACSAKTGLGVEKILPHIIQQIKPPITPTDARLRALVFDSIYDKYKGVIIYIRVFEGSVQKKDIISFMSKSKDNTFEVHEVGIFDPFPCNVTSLSAGQIGFLHANIKKLDDVDIGDTITLHKDKAEQALPGFKKVSPVVFAGIYPSNPEEFDALSSALHKLRLNDSSLTLQKEKNNALGFGFRCGLLGLLHMEIITERLKREFDIDIIICSPSVSYKCIMKDESVLEVSNPEFFPNRSQLQYTMEPWVKTNIITHQQYAGSILTLAHEKRGVCINTEVLDEHRVIFDFEFPLNEIITDFSDKLKSISQGYASFSYTMKEYKVSDIVKLVIKINDEPAESLSMLIYKKQAEQTGRRICEKLKTLIPKSLVRINIQACLDGKIVASEKISALSKNVTAKCYGGDISRKHKLWEKQKEGKKRMLQTHKVRIPTKALIEVLKTQNG